MCAARMADVVLLETFCSAGAALYTMILWFVSILFSPNRRCFIVGGDTSGGCSFPPDWNSIGNLYVQMEVA